MDALYFNYFQLLYSFSTYLGTFRQMPYSGSTANSFTEAFGELKYLLPMLEGKSSAAQNVNYVVQIL